MNAAPAAPAADAIAVGRDALGALGEPRVIVKTACGPAERTALEREVEATLRLGSPALRRVRALGRGTETTLAVFEHVDGAALGEHLARQPHDALRVAVAVLRVLRGLHDAGTAHGDLKPEHVLVERDGAVRVIDLGLVTPLGATVRGGTHGFLAPELLEGAPISPASDLFALGATLLAAAGERARAWPPALVALIAACVDPDPRRRPGAAGAALGAFGALGAHGALGAGGASGRDVRVDGVDAHALSVCREASAGSVVVVRGAARSGRTALARAVAEHELSRGALVIDVRGAPEHDPLAALATCLDIDVREDPARRAAMAAVRASAPIVIDDADALDEDACASVVSAARAVILAGRGRLVVVGASAALEASLMALQARAVTLAPLDRDGIRRVLSAHGARGDEPTVTVLLEATAGRAGEVARLAAALAAKPELAVRDLVEERAERPGEPAMEAAADALEGALAALLRGAPRRAARLLRAARPASADDPAADREAAVVLARAEAQTGELAKATAILEALGPLEPALTLELARLLERLGRREAARATALPLVASADGDVASRAATIAAACTLGLGDPSGAEGLAHDALPRATDGAVRARLWALRSDAALRLHDARSALAHAASAEREARESGDPTAIAHALSRAGAALALSGDPRRARERHVAALAEAERAGDVAALPPFVMNLATAEHALGEIADAMARYERAADLAARLGREASRAAALVNLGGLLASAEADDDARRVLADAKSAAARAGAPIYVAQALLVEAELAARRDVASARGLAREAREAFLRCGATRQALEAELLEHELDGDSPTRSHASVWLDAHRDTLDAAGLGARAALLGARLALVGDELDRARREADRAAHEAHVAGDRDLEARALVLGARVHDRLGTSAGDALRGRARAAMGELAARMPAGLRERFLAAGGRAEIVRSPAAASAASASAASAGASAGADGAEAAHAPGLGADARRLLAVVGRVLLEPDETRVLELALDEAVTLARAERAFLLLRRGEERKPEVVVARNLDRDSIRKSKFRFSRSVAERVLSSGELLVTASASDDPELRSARSVLDLGLRSILCVPVRGPTGVIAALYLDHRFETARFGEGVRELVQALADVIGLALENARLHREARARQRELEQAHEALRLESDRKDVELGRLADALARGGGAAPVTEEGGIVGGSRALRAALDIARRVAPSSLALLIEGESGTGKELFARFVHARSARATGPFVAINCGALPEALIESELFGHVRGAFTGALRDHVGVFRTADAGTLLLDEIGELPLRMQTRLLRVLQEREVRAVGSGAAIPVDVRVVAATNRDLEAEVEAGRFRRDLYFRLVGVRLRLPPLRERREDIPVLAEAALARIAHEPGMRRLVLRRDAVAALVSHAWPGNVRELEQALRRAVAIADGEELGAEHFELGGARAGRPTEARRASHQELDRELIEGALRAAGGNRTLAARALGVSRVTLHRCIARLEIDVPVRRGRPTARAPR